MAAKNRNGDTFDHPSPADPRFTAWLTSLLGAGPNSRSSLSSPPGSRLDGADLPLALDFRRVTP